MAAILKCARSGQQLSHFQKAHFFHKYRNSLLNNYANISFVCSRTSDMLNSPKNYSTGTSSAVSSRQNRGLVIVEQLDNIRLIGINRPEKRNCVNQKTALELLKAFQEFDEDDNSKVAILHGIGGNFCAGFDLKELSSAPQDIDLNEEMGPMGPSRYETTKPVIAAVSGYAVAGGLELALWCDIRIMEETAVMGVFCRRFGVPLMDGGAVRLPAIVGLGRALDLILSGRPVRAPEALQIGLANQVVPCGCALGKAVFVAEGIIRYPQEAVRADRNTARNSFYSSSMKEALINEHKLALKAIEKEAVQGASEFVKGSGRHGSFSFLGQESGSTFEDPKSKL